MTSPAPGGQQGSSPGRVPEGKMEAGARAAKREVRVLARGRSSSHANRGSILIAAAIATCCTWVFARPPYRVRRRPKARTPWESVPSTPARRLYSCCPASLADHVCAACSASYWSWGGSRRRRPVCLARVQEGRTGHAPQVCLSQATLIGRLPCPPPCSHHATDKWPWGQRTCCWSQSTANCSTVYAPSTCVCHPWLGRVGPRRVMPWASRLWTSNSELIEAASTRCSSGGTSLSTSACWMGSVHCASCTVAGVVCTCVSTCGAVGSHVSLTCTI